MDGGSAVAATALGTRSGGAFTLSEKSLMPFAIMLSAGTAEWMSRSRTGGVLNSVVGQGWGEVAFSGLAGVDQP